MTPITDKIKMLPDGECQELLQQDGRRLFCDTCGFESRLADPVPRSKRSRTLRETNSDLKAENARLVSELETKTRALDMKDPYKCEECRSIIPFEYVHSIEEDTDPTGCGMTVYNECPVCESSDIAQTALEGKELENADNPSERISTCS